MRKIIAAAFVSLDSVMQAPGGPDEDPSGGFAHGGWVAPLWDDTVSAWVRELFAYPFDLLLGRKTYDIFAAFWPEVAAKPGEAAPGDAWIAKQFAEATKYVATHRADTLGWKTSHALGSDIVASLREIVKQDGRPLITQGSSELVHQLLANELVDELQLMTFPVTLGRGKRFFDETSTASTFEVVKSVVSSTGVVMAKYRRSGPVTTGSIS